MARRPFRIPFGPFDLGLINAMDPADIPTGGAQVALNVDLSEGTLRGLYGVGPVVATQEEVTAEDAFTILWVADDRWIVSAGDLRQLVDYDAVNAKKASVVTSGGGPLLLYTNGTADPLEGLGLVAPSGELGIAGMVGGTAQLNVRYAVTYVTADGLESNPAFTPPYDSAVGCNYELPVSSDSRVTARRVYRTLNIPAGDIVGADFCFLREIANNTSTDADDDDEIPLDQTRMLRWQAGGGPDVPFFQFDHEPSPETFTVVADVPLPAFSGQAGPSGGIALAAGARGVRWSAAGNLHYWPSRNTWAPPDIAQAIAIGPTSALVFTPGEVFTLSGGDDTTLGPDRLVGVAGVVPGGGKTVAGSPLGHFYRAREGVMLLADQVAQRVTPQLTTDYWLGLDSLGGPVSFAGAWHGQRYYLAHDDGIVVLDCSRWPKVAVVECDVVATALHTIAFAATSGNAGPGLYVSIRDDWDEASRPQIRVWNPEQSTTRGDRLPWTWRTGRVTARDFGGAGRTKLATKLYLRRNATGDLLVRVRFDGSTVKTITMTPGIGPGKSWTWLPQGYWEFLELEIESEDGTAEVYGFEVEGVVL
jgi:hypothetical protein